MQNIHHPSSQFDLIDGISGWLAGNTSGLCIAAAYLLFSVLERRFPFWNWPQKTLRQSSRTNLSLFIVNNVLLSLLSIPALLTLTEHYSSQNVISYLSPPGQAVVSFLLFDLSIYAWHWASHRFAWLWQFHRVHHSDLTMNISTAFRVHLLDHITMTLAKAAYIVLFGFSKESVVLNEALNTLFLIFHHSNLAFRGEKWLGNFIIVPYLHRLHHSAQRQENDRNFGAILSVWDRLFGTLLENQPERLGIKQAIPQDLFGLIKAGFGINQPVPVQEMSASLLETMIAEAAYYRAEKRNFSPGYELRDWLEARKEIIKQVCNDTPRNHQGYGAASFLRQKLC